MYISGQARPRHDRHYETWVAPSVKLRYISGVPDVTGSRYIHRTFAWAKRSVGDRTDRWFELGSS